VKELLKERPKLAGSKDREGPLATFALTRAVGLDQKEIVALLLDAGAPVNAKDAQGYTALHTAAFRGRAEIAKLLIDRGADVNGTASDGFTPLHQAAWRGNCAVARLLLAAGADVNARDDKGRTPLSWAKHAEMVQLLREHGGME